MNTDGNPTLVVAVPTPKAAELGRLIAAGATPSEIKAVLDGRLTMAEVEGRHKARKEGAGGEV